MRLALIALILAVALEAAVIVGLIIKFRNRNEEPHG